MKTPIALRSFRGRRSAPAVVVFVLLALWPGTTKAQQVTGFPIPTANSLPTGIALGPDGNLWFTETNANQIGRITPAGVVTEFPVDPAQVFSPIAITAGPDGNLWFAGFTGGGDNPKIGRMTTTGAYTAFPVASAGDPGAIAAGPDGNVWFTEYAANKIARITPAGVVTEFPVPTAMSAPYGITQGPDGAMWFVENAFPKIGRITTAGDITEFPLSTGSPAAFLVRGPDQNLWLGGTNADALIRYTPGSGDTSVPVTGRPNDLAISADGAIWYLDALAAKAGRYPIGGSSTEYTLDNLGSNIAAGSDGALWFTDHTANKIGRITTAPLIPQPMAVDAHGVTGSSSNANGVFEPGETVLVAPAWTNTQTGSQSFTGTASDLSGPAGPSYAIDDSSASYGTAAAGATVTCDSGNDCYLMTIAGARPAAHWDATFDETLSVDSIGRSWTLHVGESFPDVPTTSLFYKYVENLFHNGVTGGCAGGNYCPATSVTRAQMAVFLLKGKLGPSNVPPPATGTVFDDVQPGDFAAAWIEQLAAFQITGGCGNGDYCPASPVTRKQMAVFLLKAEHGSTYVPPACTHVFADVPCPSPFADWVERLAAEGITGGCGGGNYCPDSPNTRGQMAVFLVKAFGLNLYGP
jgi:streptogramin lyase